jgi:DNA-binding CsgD family transcriptional regulator
MNLAPRIILTRKERTRLEALATGQRVPRALAKRAQTILACAEGDTNLVVGSEIGITNLTVGRWRREFLLNRLKGFGVEHRGRPVRPLLLSSTERRTLQGWLRSPPVSTGLAARARVILACARGKSNISVARATGMSEQTVSKFRQRFLSDRLVGLRPDQPGRPAAPVTLSSDERTTLENWSHTSRISSALARRSQVILACANAKTNLQVARELGLSGRTVGYLRRRFLVHGLDALNLVKTPTVVGR